jgi:hypothetical protein
MSQEIAGARAEATLWARLLEAERWQKQTEPTRAVQDCG